MVLRRLIAAVLVLAAAAPASAGPAGEPILERLTDIGASISLGFGVSPLRPQLTPPAPAMPGPAEAELPSTALSFDLKLGWPGSEAARLEPYVALGPALFVVEPDHFGRLLGTRVDPALRLGAKAGAGLNWHVGKDTTLFGAYEATTGLSPRGSRDDVSGFDLIYGIKLRY